MRWLIVLGVSLDLAGAVLIASAVVGRTPAENREEALTVLDGNLWIVLFREQEQVRVRNGMGLIGAGFVLQLAAYLWGFESWLALVAAAVALATVALSLGLAWWWSERAVPLTYYEELDLPAGIEDQRHMYRQPTKEGIRKWWELWAERMLGHELVDSNETVKARVNVGRWLTQDCPRCPGGVMPAWPDNERVACSSRGMTYLVAFPAERAEIERLLLHRPKEQDRAWEPGQTLDDLRRQNEADGLPT